MCPRPLVDLFHFGYIKSIKGVGWPNKKKRRHNGAIQSQGQFKIAIYLSSPFIKIFYYKENFVLNMKIFLILI